MIFDTLSDHLRVFPEDDHRFAMIIFDDTLRSLDDTLRYRWESNSKFQSNKTITGWREIAKGMK